MRRWVRTVLAFTIALAAWVVVTPASAASGMTSSVVEPPFAGGRAPLCDDRAATMFAPAPQLQAPQTSIDVFDSGDDCISNFLDDGVAHQGGDSPRGAPTAPDAAMTVMVPGVAPASHAATAAPRAAYFAVPLGVQTRLDRPPRHV